MRARGILALWATVVIMLFGVAPGWGEVSLGANTSSIEERVQLENAPATIAELTEDVKTYQPQLPDLGGWSVYDTWPVVLADDWLCTETGPVTDIRLWGSWMDDSVGQFIGLWIAIHENPPEPPHGRPGQLLWSRFFTHFQQAPLADSAQGWYDQVLEQWEHPDHRICWQYDITDIPNPFIQQEGRTYWLNVMADFATQHPHAPLWGWNTSLEHQGDNAVWAFIEAPFNWTPLEEPTTGNRLDMAFQVISSQGILCGDANNDGVVDLADAVHLLNFLFRSGPAPLLNLCVADADNDKEVSIGDVVYLLNYLFKDAVAPHPDCCT